MAFSGKERVKKGTVKFWHDMNNIPRGWISATEFTGAVISGSANQISIDAGFYGNKNAWEAPITKPGVSLSNIGVSVSNHVLSENQLASHYHGHTTNTGNSYGANLVAGYGGGPAFSQNAGGNEGHNHGVSVDQPAVTVYDMANLEIRTKFIGMIRKL